jgi:hypothetical protein
LFLKCSPKRNGGLSKFLLTETRPTWWTYFQRTRLACYSHEPLSLDPSIPPIIARSQHFLFIHDFFIKGHHFLSLHLLLTFVSKRQQSSIYSTQRATRKQHSIRGKSIADKGDALNGNLEYEPPSPNRREPPHSLSQHHLSSHILRPAQHTQSS